MSVSKWAWTEACDNGICIGDCDLCDRAEPKFGEWVPVSKKLPPEGDLVIVTVEGVLGSYVHVGIYYQGIWFDYRRRQLFDNESVIAWMPLPEPYKEGEE